jgi:hypothetical protein
MLKIFHSKLEGGTGTSKTTRSNPKLQNINTKLALVIPFTEFQAPKVKQNIESVWKTNPPCDLKQFAQNDAAIKTKPDLIFYFHKNILSDSSRTWIPQLKRTISQSPSLSNCFGSVHFVNALLTDEEDTYPLGASRMFFKLIGTPTHKSLLSSKSIPHSPYTSFYYMEPDNIPCRANWLDQLVEESSRADFWMRGSIIRDGNPQVSEWTFAQHINGNAMYSLSDPKFISFVDKVSRVFWQDPDAFLGSYDIALDLVRRNRSLVDWVEFTGTVSKWQYTETVQNWYRTTVDAGRLCNENELTFLVHGRNVVQTK